MCGPQHKCGGRRASLARVLVFYPLSQGLCSLLLLHGLCQAWLTGFHGVPAFHLPVGVLQSDAGYLDPGGRVGSSSGPHTWVVGVLPKEPWP